MLTRLIGCLLLSSCFVPDFVIEEAPARDRAEGSSRAVFVSRERASGAAGAPACSHEVCSDTAISVGRSSVKSGALRERSVRIQTGTKAPPDVEVIVDLPVVIVDCSAVRLTIVGDWHAALGGSIVLEAVASGGDEESALDWTMAGGEVTVLGPLTAAIKCTEPGQHVLKVGFAPPAPCPSTIELEIECEP